MCEHLRQNFDSDTPFQPRIARLIDFAHSPGSKVGLNPIMQKFCADDRVTHGDARVFLGRESDLGICEISETRCRLQPQFDHTARATSVQNACLRKGGPHCSHRFGSLMACLLSAAEAPTKLKDS